MSEEKKMEEQKTKPVVSSDAIIIDGVEYETWEQQVFNTCLSLLKNKLKGKELCFENMMIFVRHAMEVAEGTKKKGVEQKKLAIDLVKKIIVDSPISDEKEKLLLNICDMGVLSSTIDLIVAASKGQLDINVVKKSCFSCLPFFKK
tara:strand:- start:181 stop:618 length:438 start_codon:yes stop_codon:yes gene_type:complete